jgi:hypothetical protein
VISINVLFLLSRFERDRGSEVGKKDFGKSLEWLIGCFNFAVAFGGLGLRGGKSGVERWPANGRREAFRKVL